MYENPEAEAETLANSDQAATAGEGHEGGETFRPQRVKVAARMATLRQRGVEIDEWLAEEFTAIERQLQALQDAVRKRKQPIVWFNTARDVLDALDRGVVKDKNEARKLLGLTGRVAKRKQPAALAAAQAARRARS